MGNSSFKNLSASELLKMTSHRNFCTLVRREHNQVMGVLLQGTTAIFSREENSEKNRHTDIPCWDHSRVIISSRESLVFDRSVWEISRIVITPEKSVSTYIHANYVDGFETIDKYICTQTPMENMRETFMKLIWERNSRVIVSLTDLNEDDQITYALWVKPQGSETIIGRYVVKTLEIAEQQSFTKTRLRITNRTTETSREITNFWFTDWPDKSIPTGLEEFLDLRSEVNREQFRLMTEATESNSRTPGPIVVHCSTGAGWTGTYCAIDNALAQLVKEGKVSIPQTVMKIRSQRHSSVFRPEQYAFCYKVLEHVLLAKADRSHSNLKGYSWE